MANKTGVPITVRALTQRINRALEGNNQALKAARGLARLQLGHYYVLDTGKNEVARKDVDIEKLGREIGALKDFEKLDRSAEQ